ncbi:MAG: glutamate--tRNA ligase [Planctomycetes bacterium]|nr:glutamate--tRNA ligase [Planctomycetota bacterium]
MGDRSSNVRRTRFAPSPTGHLHVGGARTALFCWALARANGGRFLLRIEDTDRRRSSESSTRELLEGLEWLGIDWDEGLEYKAWGGGESGPYRQSERLDLYRVHAERLIKQGAAYRAFETPQELEAARAAAAAERRGYRYDRAALRLDPETIARYLREHRPYVVRFRVPDEGEITVQDEVRGDVCVSAEELDDLVIMKADGYPTYHFAVVVDDELMGVTHVIRGQEHLYNTARHVLLQEALGFRRPAYAHLSLIFNPDGSKMSKRDKDRALRRAVADAGIEDPPRCPASDEPVVSQEHWAWWRASKDHQLELEPAERLAEALGVDLPEIDVEDFRRAGYLPEVLVNYLALLGWSPGGDREKFDRAFLIEHFDLDRIVKSPARFDREKLRAFNLDALQAMSGEAFEKQLRAHGERYRAEFLEKLGERKFSLFAAANHARSKTLDDPFRDGRFFVIADDEVVYEQSKAVRKALGGDPSGCARLEALVPILQNLAEWSGPALEEAVTRYADEHAGGKLGKVAQPLRIAVSGGPVSPAIFDTLVILGREATLNRIRRCLAERRADTVG